MDDLTSPVSMMLTEVLHSPVETFASMKKMPAIAFWMLSPLNVAVEVPHVDLPPLDVKRGSAMPEDAEVQRANA